MYKSIPSTVDHEPSDTRAKLGIANFFQSTLWKDHNFCTKSHAQSCPFRRHPHFSLGWRRITRSGIAFLFRFSIPLLLDIAVHALYSVKSPSITASTLTKFSLTFCSCHPWIWWGIFAINSQSRAPPCATSFSQNVVIIILKLQSDTSVVPYSCWRLC